MGGQQLRELRLEIVPVLEEAVPVAHVEEVPEAARLALISRGQLRRHVRALHKVHHSGGGRSGGSAGADNRAAVPLRANCNVNSRKVDRMPQGRCWGLLKTGAWAGNKVQHASRVFTRCMHCGLQEICYKQQICMQHEPQHANASLALERMQCSAQACRTIE